MIAAVPIYHLEMECFNNNSFLIESMTTGYLEFLPTKCPIKVNEMKRFLCLRCKSKKDGNISKQSVSY